MNVCIVNDAAIRKTILSVKIYQNLRRNFGFEIYVNKFHAISYMYVREISKM
jgi:hypothetical protein